jgi:hypothetical protein
MGKVILQLVWHIQPSGVFLYKFDTLGLIVNSTHALTNMTINLNCDWSSIVWVLYNRWTTKDCKNEETIPITSILLKTNKTNNDHKMLVNSTKSGDDNDNPNSKSLIVQLEYYFFFLYKKEGN